MRTKLRSKATLLFMVCAVLVAIPAIALADVFDNNLDPASDNITAARENVSVEAGKSTDVGIRVVPSGSDGDAGCNFDAGNEQVKVSVTSADTSKVTVSPTELTFKGCDDPATANIENEKTVTVTGVADGSNINIDFAEVAGSNNTGGTFTYTGANFRVDVTPDVTAPSVAITSPNDGDTTTNSSINVSGTASDGSGIQSVKVNGNTATLGTGNSWSYNNLPLSCGSNTITAVATDNSANHNTANTSITVTRSCNTASISGTVYQDSNGNGSLDAGEPGISGVSVSRSGTSSGTTTTNASGAYTFSSLAAGTYSVDYTVPTGYANTGATKPITNISVSAGQTVTGKDFFARKQTSTSLARTAGSSPSTYGASQTFTATVTSGAGDPNNEGSVQFKDNGNTITNCASVSLTGKTAACTVSNLSFGSHNITAVYSGTTSGNGFAGSTSGSVTQSVDQKAELTVSGLSASNKVYDGNTNATITGTGSLVGVLAGDTVTLSGTPSGSFADANAGPGKSVTVSGLSLSGASATNYSLTQPQLSADINQRTVTASITAANKPYDGNDNAQITGCTLDSASGNTGVLSGETSIVGCSASNAHFDSASAENGKTVTADVSLTGTGAANYQLSSNTASTTANITKVTLTPSVTVNNKPYDGTTSATINTRGFTNPGAIVGTEAVSLTGGTATFATAGAGTHKLVNVTNLSLGGTDAANYQLSSTSTTAYADINQRLVTATITAADKDYDGTTNANAQCSLDSQSGDTGVVTGETNVGCSASNAHFDSASAGQNKTVTADVSLTGTGAVNYQLTSNTASDTSVEIRKVQLTVTADNQTKTLGQSDPTFTFTYGAFVNNENSGVIDTAPTCGVSVTHTNVGSYPIVCSGGSDNNYSFTYVPGTLKIVYGTGFGGFLQPINTDGSSRFKLGSTIPVKFQLKDATGALVTGDQIAQLAVNQSDTKPDAGVDEAISTAAATTGNWFRYDATSGQHIFNLSTKSGYTTPDLNNPGQTKTVQFSQGTWTLWILLNDGTSRSVKIQLVK